MTFFATLAYVIYIAFQASKCETILTQDDEQHLERIFENADLNNNTLLNRTEFSSIVDDLFLFSATFKTIDINRDTKLEYVELVYAFKTLITQNPGIIFQGTENEQEWNELDSTYESLLDPTQTYNDQVEAEMLANTLLYEMDKDKDNYISDEEFVNTQIDDIWNEIVSSDDSMTLNQFENNFFGDNYFEMLHEFEDSPEYDAEFSQYLNRLESAHDESDEIFQTELLFEPHDFDDDIVEIIEDEANGRRRLLFWSKIFNPIKKAVNKVAVFTGIKRNSCPDKSFKNWLGNIFIVSSTEQCTWRKYGVCIISKCCPSTDIWLLAKQSSGWTKQSCFDFKVGASKTDDHKCSIPHHDPVHSNLFDPSCKIHDFCLKTNGRSRNECDSEFSNNMHHQCDIQFPDLETKAALALCKTTASVWYAAVWIASQLRGGLNDNDCK